VGEEPYCYVTNEYNNAMKALLPQYGIQVVELPRIELNNEPISASKVRRLFEAGEMGMVKKLVPAATLEILNREKDDE
jgi:[citrate (pro-3S)-lyase] ligase